MKTLIRNGVKGLFSDTDWKSGQPQRYGWQEEGREKKELPKEIIAFIERKRPPDLEQRTVQDDMDELSQPDFATGGIIIPEDFLNSKVESLGGEKIIPEKPFYVGVGDPNMSDEKLAKAFLKAEKKSHKPEKLEFETSLGEKIVIKGEKVTKTKKNDNPKQKDGGAAKRKPRGMAKN